MFRGHTFDWKINKQKAEAKSGKLECTAMATVSSGGSQELWLGQLGWRLIKGCI